MMSKIEKRTIELRVDENNRNIKGTAIVFNDASELLGQSFREIILPDAVTRELIDSSNIVMLYNHDKNNVPLARRNKGKGTLNIEIRNDGVGFEFKAKKTQLGDEVLEAVRSGDLDSCSFAFVVDESGDKWEKRNDGTYLRTISKFKSLHDFSIVVDPAYSSTEVNTRGLDALIALEKREIEEQPKEEVEQEKEPTISDVIEKLEALELRVFKLESLREPTDEEPIEENNIEEEQPEEEVETEPTISEVIKRIDELEIRVYELEKIEPIDDNKDEERYKVINFYKEYDELINVLKS